MTELGWGFIGASIWARTRMAPAVRATEGNRALAVASHSEPRARAFARECGIPRAHGSIEALLSDPEIDVVYISSVNQLHAAQAIAAAAAGKHVLCEKPLATSLADAELMIAACDRAGVVLATNHHLRGSPAITAMRRLVAEGAIGDLVAAQIAFLSSLPVEMRTWRLQDSEGGGGVAMDLTVHDADTLRFLLDDEIVDVSARTASGRLGRGRVEDSIMGVMSTGRGPLVSFHDSFDVPHAANRVEIHGTEGSLLGEGVLSPDPVGELTLRRGQTLEIVATPDRRSLYERAVEMFAAAVRGEGEPLCSGADGIASLAVALAARESAREDRPARVPGVP